MDLRDPQNVGKSRNARFINRVFTPDEQKLISDAAHQDAMLWALWAGKETAYKVISKCYPSVTSVPLLYEVKLSPAATSATSSGFPAGNNTLAGFVDTPYKKVSIRIFMTPDYVHCVGTTSSLEEMNSVVWHVDRISPDSEAMPDYESVFVRKALKRRLLTYLDGTPEDIEIRREKGFKGLGPPFVYINGRRGKTDISLSHDGLFTAYAFTI
ncbi:MAG: 4'-phosphopantetheinyl transferase superfamily protein [Deltaproteobacteria bacterium]|nr:4'-phosphopantetheinyl transferase superfamily protein [Deltaproteobacteria bacterium]